MNWLSVINALFKMLFLWWKKKTERDEERKKKLTEAYSEVKDGIKKRDPSKITSGFDRANRI